MSVRDISRTRSVITKGVYADKFGVAIVVSVQGKPREFRSDADGRKYTIARGGPAWFRDERKRVLAREQLKATRQAAAADTFAHDVRQYLKTIESATHRRNAAGYLAHWEQAFGDLSRHEITALAVKARFAQIDKAPSTKNHIRRELFVFFRTMNGIDGPNPAADLKAVQEHYPDARALSYDVIEKILAALQPSPSKARLLVMAYTGLPQSLIAKLRPSDLHLERAELSVRPRRKGAGVEGRQLPLSPAGVAALREFERLNAFGPFQNRQLVNTFAHGITKAGVTVPEGTRPYDLRHSFLTEVYRQTGDLKAVSELGMHATLEQTARYAKGAVSERATKVIGSVPRFSATTAPGIEGNSEELKGTVVHSNPTRKPRLKR